MKKTKVISIAIHKGGAGKSSIATNLSYELKDMGKNVLLIDTDSQMNATHSLDLSSNEKNFYKAFVGKESLKKHIINTRYENLDIVVGDIRLAGIEKIMYSMDFKELRMKEILKEVLESNIYDYILIDQNPSLGMLNTSLLHATDYILIPVEPSAFGIEGLDLFLEHYKGIKEYHNDLEILGIVFNKVDKREMLSSDSVLVVKKIFGDILMDTIIPIDANIKNSQWEHLPLKIYNKNSRAVDAFKNLAIEVVSRVEK